MFGNVGFPELFIILAIALLLFGAGKLPEVGRGVGKAFREFKNAVMGSEDTEPGSRRGSKKPR